MNTGETTIFVVDDDPSVRRGLARLIRSAGWNAAAFATAGEFLEQLPFSGTGCVILDVRMPGMSGPELHEQITRRGIALPIIFLSGHADVPTSVQAMKRGAVDFLTKPVDDKILLEAIRRAVERHGTAQAQERQGQRIHERLARLSSREREVMEYVVGGYRNKEIAAALGIAEKTIKVHRGRVMQKLKVCSVAELVRLCEMAQIRPRRISADSAATQTES